MRSVVFTYVILTIIPSVYLAEVSSVFQIADPNSHEAITAAVYAVNEYTKLSYSPADKLLNAILDAELNIKEGRQYKLVVKLSELDCKKPQICIFGVMMGNPKRLLSHSCGPVVDVMLCSNEDSSEEELTLNSEPATISNGTDSEASDSGAVRPSNVMAVKYEDESWEKI